MVKRSPEDFEVIKVMEVTLPSVPLLDITRKAMPSKASANTSAPVVALPKPPEVTNVLPKSPDIQTLPPKALDGVPSAMSPFDMEKSALAANSSKSKKNSVMNLNYRRWLQQ